MLGYEIELSSITTKVSERPITWHMISSLEDSVTEDISLSHDNRQAEVHNRMSQFIQAKLSYPLNKAKWGHQVGTQSCVK